VTEVETEEIEEEVYGPRSFGEAVEAIEDGGIVVGYEDGGEVAYVDQGNWHKASGQDTLVSFKEQDTKGEIHVNAEQFVIAVIRKPQPEEGDG